MDSYYFPLAVVKVHQTKGNAVPTPPLINIKHSYTSEFMKTKTLGGGGTTTCLEAHSWRTLPSPVVLTASN